MMTYKVTMSIGNDRWTIVDGANNMDEAIKYLWQWRNSMKDRTFRLEKHIMEVVPV